MVSKKYDENNDTQNHGLYLWVARFSDFSGLSLEEIRNSLSLEEKRKAQTIKKPIIQRHYILSKYFLRQCLSQYVHLMPAELVFGRAEHGRPFLSNVADIDFNLSHSHDCWVCLIAARSNVLVGIDIEYKSRKNNIESIAQRYFHTREQQVLNTLSGQAYRDQFFTFWTLKESYLKARGDGIAYGLDQCYFLYQQDDNANQSFKVVDTKEEGGELHWFNDSFAFLDDYQLGFAVGEDTVDKNFLSQENLEMKFLTPGKV